MTKPQRTSAADTDIEYRAIEATLLASARGRWFLAEHGRRARRLDNALIEDAITRLNASLREPSALLGQLSGQVKAVRAVIAEIDTALSARPLAPRGPSPLDGGTPVTSVAAAPGQTLQQSILAVSESVHELAWTLQGREGRDFDPSTLEQIGRQVMAIYAMSRHQAVETEYTLRLLERLRSADDKLAAILETLTYEEASSPAPDAN